MKTNTRTILTGSFALLLASTPASAVPDFWDGGGGGGDGLLNNLNWVDDTAPVSDVNTTDLFFLGIAGLNPDVPGGGFSAKSVVFMPGAGSFQFIGAPLTIGAGGITNSSFERQEFENQINIGAASSTFNAMSEELHFHGTVALGANTLNLDGEMEFFGALSIGTGTLNVDVQSGQSTIIGNDLTGTGTINKTGAGSLFLGKGQTILADVFVSGGEFLLSPGEGPFTLGGSGSIAIGTGATLIIYESLTLINGAQLTKAADGEIQFSAVHEMRIESGSDLVSSDGLRIDSIASVTVTGAGSTLQTTSGNLSVMLGATLAVLNGGSASTTGHLNVGSSDVGTLTVSGAGSSISTGSGISEWGSFGSAILTFSNNATGSITGVDIASLGDADIQILSGADITNTGRLVLAGFPNGGTGTLVVSGAGTTWQQLGASEVTIGAPSGGGGTLAVSNGAGFSASGNFIVNATGTVSLDGSTLSASGAVSNSGVLTVVNGAAFTTNSAFANNATGTVTLDGGVFTVHGAVSNSGTFNFTAGLLELLGANDLTVGTGGFLGTNVTLTGARQVTIGDTTTVNAFRTLTLDGGTFTTGALVNNGTLAFNSGTLAITGLGGLAVGTGPLGANVTLGSGRTLAISSATGVGATAQLTVAGGNFSTGILVNDGLITHDSGVFTVSGLVANNSGGRIFASRPLTIGGTLTNSAGARITLEDGTGSLGGAGALSNSGLITGDGVISLATVNLAGGEIRAESGKTLYFTGASGGNNGRLNLLGGTLSFAQAFTNGSTGQINGAGVLYFPTNPVPSSGSPTAGFNNVGQLNFSGGDSQIFGTVQMGAGSKLVVSGGATATFYDVFRHSGAEVKASAGSSIVFFGQVRGAGSFTGGGSIYMEGGYSPGNSPAMVTLDAPIVLGDANVLTLELGGTTAGIGPASDPLAGYDQLFHAENGQLSVDGTLLIDFINGFTPVVGQSFQLFDFEPGQISGGFDEIVFADALPSGTSFDTSNLLINGQVAVVPEPSSALLLLGGLALAARRRRK